jgi:uncharacterized protein (TIGR04255 family)
MGEFQIKVMRDFPRSGMALQRQFLIAQGIQVPRSSPQKPLQQFFLSPMAQEASSPQDLPQDVTKMWTFESENGVKLQVQTDSMSLQSTLHKTYNKSSEEHKFRDSIEKALNALKAVAPVPLFLRVGLRYVDDCPVPALNNEAYSQYYNTMLALDRFNLADAEELTHMAVMRRGNRHIRICEALRVVDGKPVLTLDCDAYAINVESGNCLGVTDGLHDLVADEYEKTLKKPVFEHMRHPQS